MKNGLNCRVLLTTFVVIAFGALFYADNASALTITPVRFEISGNPGDTLRGELLLINENETAETFYSTFSNFEAQGESA